MRKLFLASRIMKVKRKIVFVRASLSNPAFVKQTENVMFRTEKSVSGANLSANFQMKYFTTTCAGPMVWGVCLLFFLWKCLSASIWLCARWVYCFLICPPEGEYAIGVSSQWYFQINRIVYSWNPRLFS